MKFSLPWTSENRPIGFNKFLWLAKAFYVSIGVEPYDQAFGKIRFYLLELFYIINLLNLNFVLFTELAFVVQAMVNGNNFLEATMNLSYIGFVFVGDIKICSIWMKRHKMTKLMENLRKIYPEGEQIQEKFGDQSNESVLEVQRAYRVRETLKRYHKISYFFVIVHLILVWTYNLFPVLTYAIYDVWLGTAEVPRLLPYFIWVPWDWHVHFWTYHFLYASQNLAGHTCMNGQLANDLLLCVVVTQIIMHYNYLAKRIRAHVADGKGSSGEKEEGSRDLEFLKFVIKYHQKILSLSNEMNDVFGFSLLLNFFTSAFIICFLGFQTTIGVSTTILLMLLLFIFCSLVQIYMLTNYGQELIIASESIGHAVYEHDWFEADLQYKKMLVLIIKRAQKPAIMKATTFLNVSLNTMTDLIQLSYKFFALLRTMYSKK